VVAAGSAGRSDVVAVGSAGRSDVVVVGSVAACSGAVRPARGLRVRLARPVAAPDSPSASAVDPAGRAPSSAERGAGVAVRLRLDRLARAGAASVAGPVGEVGAASPSVAAAAASVRSGAGFGTTGAPVRSAALVVSVCAATGCAGSVVAAGRDGSRVAASGGTALGPVAGAGGVAAAGPVAGAGGVAASGSVAGAAGRAGAGSAGGVGRPAASTSMAEVRRPGGGDPGR
jgi:hypothetical protein